MLSVEVDNQPGWTASDAEAYLTDLLADDGALRDASRSGYLMLLSQEIAFAWTVRTGSPPQLSWVTEASVADIFDGYSRRAGIAHRMRGSTLRMLAVDWLSRICGGLAADSDLPPELVKAGVIDAIRDGHLAWRIEGD